MSAEPKENLPDVISSIRYASIGAADIGFHRTAKEIYALADRIASADIVKEVDSSTSGKVVLSIWHSDGECNHYSCASLCHARQLFDMLGFALREEVKDLSKENTYFSLTTKDLTIEVVEYPF